MAPSVDGSGVRGYPRPQLRRAAWESLNGRWEFALDVRAQVDRPNEVRWEGTIVVPFSPETPASGVGDTSFYERCWYRRRFQVAPLGAGERMVLHFGAVDTEAVVYVDGRFVGRHEGGYTPFSLDVTQEVAGGGEHELVVRADDDPQDLAKPRGKQDWQKDPHSIWYPRTTGIWQTVWLERLPPTAISVLRWTPNLARWEIGLHAVLSGKEPDAHSLEVLLRARGQLLAHDHYRVVAGEVTRRIALSDPGIDDSRNDLLWNPASPTLIQAELTLRDGEGQGVDTVHSYTALRDVALQGDRFLLNGRPYVLRMVLDQGYWEQTGLTAPNDAAIRRDVELAKSMGFNGVRKHQKLEDPCYLYWADRLGLLVWGEMPSAYRFTKRSVERVTREWTDAVRRDYSHPCLVAWVPINESWGVPNLPDNAEERHLVQALYHLTKTLDPTRPVIGNDGWESVTTDIIGIHDYDPDPESLARRYHADVERPRLFRRERPGGRSLLLVNEQSEHPVVLSEFGGIALERSGRGTWGYSRAVDGPELAERYTKLLETVRSLHLLAGFCYTQFADTYQEANGLLHADRTPKFPLERIAAATRGERFYSDVSMPPAPRTKNGEDPEGDES